MEKRTSLDEVIRIVRNSIFLVDHGFAESRWYAHACVVEYPDVGKRIVAPFHVLRNGLARIIDPRTEMQVGNGLYAFYTPRQSVDFAISCEQFEGPEKGLTIASPKLGEDIRIIGFRGPKLFPFQIQAKIVGVDNGLYDGIYRGKVRRDRSKIIFLCKGDDEIIQGMSGSVAVNYSGNALGILSGGIPRAHSGRIGLLSPFPTRLD